MSDILITVLVSVDGSGVGTWLGIAQFDSGRLSLRDWVDAVCWPIAMVVRAVRDE